MMKAKEIFQRHPQNWKFNLLYDIGSHIISFGYRFYILAMKFYKRQ